MYKFCFFLSRTFFLSTPTGGTLRPLPKHKLEEERTCLGGTPQQLLKATSWLKICSSNSLQLLFERKHHPHLEAFWYPISQWWKHTAEHRIIQSMFYIYYSHRSIFRWTLLYQHRSWHRTPGNFLCLHPHADREPLAERVTLLWWCSHIRTIPRQAFITNLHQQILCAKTDPSFIHTSFIYTQHAVECFLRSKTHL